MKKKVLIRVVIVVALLAAAIGMWVTRREGCATGECGQLKIFGNVDIRQVQVAFFNTGRIEQILVQEGDAVTAGQLLARLDASRYQSALERAEAQASAQEKVVARLKAGSRPEEIAEAQARVRVAQATLKDTRQKSRRLKALAADEYASKQHLEESEIAEEAAQANLDALQQVAALAEQGPRQEDIEAAQAQLKALQAARDLARQELADTQLMAPTNGIIQNRILENGDMAFPQTPVFTLALNDPVWVRAYVPEPDLGKMAPGMKAIVKTDSYPDKEYAGWVGYISPTAEFTPKQVETTDLRTRLVYEVRVFVTNPENELRLGMPATVHLALAASKDETEASAEQVQEK